LAIRPCASSFLNMVFLISYTIQSNKSAVNRLIISSSTHIKIARTPKNAVAGKTLLTNAKSNLKANYIYSGKRPSSKNNNKLGGNR
jgi:hypothetical protein